MAYYILTSESDSFIQRRDMAEKFIRVHGFAESAYLIKEKRNEFYERKAIFSSVRSLPCLLKKSDLGYYDYYISDIREISQTEYYSLVDSDNTSEIYNL